MRRFFTYAAIIILSHILVFVPYGTTVLAMQSQGGLSYASGTSEEHGTGEMLYDFLVTRPVGILATATGIGMYLVSLPFSVLGGNTEEVGKKLVEDPAEYTFKRPLGEL